MVRWIPLGRGRGRVPGRCWRGRGGGTGGGWPLWREGESAGEMLARAVGRYREVMAALPGVVPEMVQGGTIEEIDAAVQRAREAYEAVSRKVAEAQEAHIPVGNPARSAADLAAANLR